MLIPSNSGDSEFVKCQIDLRQDNCGSIEVIKAKLELGVDVMGNILSAIELVTVSLKVLFKCLMI